MKRSIIATLLILVLTLSGCKAQQEAGVAIPAEWVEENTVQKENVTVPEESETKQEPPVAEEKPSEEKKPVEQEQPVEQEKPVEQEQPVEQEKPVEQEQPVEQEKPVEQEQSVEEKIPAEESGDSEIVEFWKTVPEMSLDEAKEVFLKKMKRMNSEKKLGTLTDEERMALYVLNINYYEEDIARYSSLQASEVCFHMYLREDFKQDISAYCEAYKWEKQEFAKTYGTIKSRYEDYTVENRFFGVHMDDISGDMEGTRTFIIPCSGVQFDVWVYPNEDVVENYAHYAECYKDILRHYLSLKSVACCSGPVFSIDDSIR